MRDQLKDMPLSTALLVVVTLFVLAGSVHHVAYTFSTLEGGNLVWGYVQALGIDLGILGLAYGIQLRKRQGRSTLPLWGVLILVTFISAYANYLYGIMHQQPLQTASAFDQMVVFLRPFLLSVTLPIIMFALIEIIGEDRNYALQVQSQSAPAETPAQIQASAPEPAPSEPAPVYALVQPVARSGQRARQRSHDGATALAAVRAADPLAHKTCRETRLFTPDALQLPPGAGIARLHSAHRATAMRRSSRPSRATEPAVLPVFATRAIRLDHARSQVGIIPTAPKEVYADGHETNGA
jgi:hypothetical protein